MTSDWESKLRGWANPPSQAEIDRCTNSEKYVREAINADEKLRTRGTRVFVQGSYHNNTNVRRDSDVDIGVVCTSVFFTHYPEGTNATTFGNVDSDYPYDEFKNDIGKALMVYFDANTVSRGGKAFDIRGDRRQVEIDVAPFVEHRRYSSDGTFLSGVELRPDYDLNQRIINWPEQHYENGVAKNRDTGFRYKTMVRCLKNVRNELSDLALVDEELITGFLCECLMWNAPNEKFGHEHYVDDMRSALLFLYDNTKTDASCAEWGEVSELKYLFRPNQKWTRQGANEFVVRAWNYLGLS